MALKAYLTEEEYTASKSSLEAEAVRTAGVEYKRADDGKYYPVIEPRDGYSLENVSGLRTAVETERTQRRDAESRLKLLGDTKPEDLPGILDKARKFDGLAGKEGDVKAKFEEWKEAYTSQTQATHEAAIEVERQKVMSLRRQLDRQLIEAEATKILADAKMKGNPDLLLPIIRDVTDTIEEEVGGELALRVRVLNPAKPGKERVGKSGGNMTLLELVEEMRQDKRYAGAFEGSGSSGAGTNPANSRPDASGFPAKRSEFTDAQKARYVHEHGAAEYLKLPV